mgnify:CR=1 FL=1
MSQNLLKVKEVAQMLALSKCLVYHLVRSGDLQAVKINSSIRIRREDIDEFIQRNLSKRQISLTYLPDSKVTTGEEG